MKKIKTFTAVLLVLVLCLTWTAIVAGERDFTGIAGVWYTEDIMMEVTEEGRFVLGWDDGDWYGSLEPVLCTNDEDEEYTVYRMILDDPELTMWEELELVPDLYHPGTMTFYHDGTSGDFFYDVPVCVTDMAEDKLEWYEPYTLIDEAAGEEPAITMMITFLRPAEDVAVLKMYDQEIDDEGNLGYNGEVLEWWEQLDSQERIVVIHVFEGDLPDLAISFIGEDGTNYHFAVQISGEDGKPILWPLLPSMG